MKSFKVIRASKMTLPSLVLVTIITVIVCTLATCQQHNWTAGEKLKKDYILSSEKVQNLAVGKNKILHKVVPYPKSGARKEIIHFITCKDQYTNGKGGFVEIINGGIGHQFVTLNFTSQKGYGINFKMEIWGR